MLYLNRLPIRAVFFATALVFLCGAPAYPNVNHALRPPLKSWDQKDIKTELSIDKSSGVITFRFTRDGTEVPDNGDFEDEKGKAIERLRSSNGHIVLWQNIPGSENRRYYVVDYETLLSHAGYITRDMDAAQELVAKIVVRWLDRGLLAREIRYMSAFVQTALRNEWNASFRPQKGDFYQRSLEASLDTISSTSGFYALNTGQRAVDKIIIEQERRAILQKARAVYLGRLPRQTIKILQQRVKGQTYRQIADSTGMKENTLKSIVSRVAQDLKRLREM